MRNGLSEQIAVLDGLEVIDASAGANYSGGSSYAAGLPLMPSSVGLAAITTDGANYGGGSSYAPGLPLMPSSVGLADADLLEYMDSGVPSVLPPKSGVINPGGGALYVGGSSWTPGLPVMPGTGLAGCGGNALSDLQCAARKLEGLQAITTDGANYGGGSSYAPGLPLMPSSVGLAGLEVIDASAGANYSGGSSYAAGLPLMPSSVGLAGLDGLDDSMFLRKIRKGMRPAFLKVASKSKVTGLKAAIRRMAAAAQKAPPAKRAGFMAAIRGKIRKLHQARTIRSRVLRQMRPLISPTFP